jgi:hypothetical protein
MMNPALSQFRSEIVNFSLVSLINIVFAILGIAFGFAYMIMAVIGHPLYPGNPAFRIFAGIIAMVCFGLGISWLLPTLKIFQGIRSIWDTLGASGDSLPEDRVTCLIVRMLAHYRENRKTIRTMILISTIGGCFFLLLGIITGLRAVSFTGSSGSVTLDSLGILPALLLTLGIALASILSSWYFSNFARVWDGRLCAIEVSECALKEKLGLDES